MKLWSVAIVVWSLNLIQTNIAYNNVISNYTEIRHILAKYRVQIGSKHGRSVDIKIDPGLISNSTQNDGTEVTSNLRVGIASELFENDILLTLPQAQALLTESRSKRQKNYTQRFWKHHDINYIFIGSEENWKNLIRKSLKHIEEQTCFRFHENKTSQDYLAFFRGSGCWSSVGCIGGRQHISIGFGCESEGIIIHETLHSLGLWHEQSRNDRDKFIHINYNNIIPGLEYNFEKRSQESSNSLEQPYDIGSIMHYGPVAFANNYKLSISAKDQAYQHTMGQRAGLSFKDAKILNLRYCSEVCSKKTNCSNGGYVDPNNCSRCRCPSGFGGLTCDQVKKSKSENCGGELKAIKNYQILEIPRINSTMHCVWRITTSAPSIKLLVDRLDLPCSITCKNYIEVKYKTDFIPTGARICCPQVRNTFFSENQQLVIIFKTTPNSDNRFSGFRIRYKSVRNKLKNISKTNNEIMQKSSLNNWNVVKNLNGSTPMKGRNLLVSGDVIGKAFNDKVNSIVEQDEEDFSTTQSVDADTSAIVKVPEARNATVTSRNQSVNVADRPEKNLSSNVSNKHHNDTGEEVSSIVEKHFIWTLALIDKSKPNGLEAKNLSQNTSNVNTDHSIKAVTSAKTFNRKKLIEGVMKGGKKLTQIITGTVFPKKAILQNLNKVIDKEIISIKQQQNISKFRMPYYTSENVLVSVNEKNVTLNSKRLLQEMKLKNNTAVSVEVKQKFSSKLIQHKRYFENYWSEWSDWSNCTVKCGGCGLRVRVRACYGTMKKCQGKTEEQKRCGFQRCNVPQRMTECYGRIVVPCNLMDQLNFTVPDSKIKYLPSALVPKLEMTEKNIRLLKRLKRTRLNRNVDSWGTQLCERRFTFQCPSHSVSLNIDWKANNLSIPKSIYDIRGCCEGYYFNGTICIPN